MRCLRLRKFYPPLACFYGNSNGTPASFGGFAGARLYIHLIALGRLGY